MPIRAGSVFSQSWVSKPFLEPFITGYESINTAIKLHQGSSFSLIKYTTALKTVSDLTVGRFKEPQCSTMELQYKSGILVIITLCESSGL